MKSSIAVATRRMTRGCGGHRALIALAAIVSLSATVWDAAAEPPVKVVRQGVAQVDPELLIENVRSGAPRLTMALFPDVQISASATKVERSQPQQAVWVGQVEGEDAGSVILAAHGDSLYGSIRLQGGEVYAIRRGDDEAELVAKRLDLSSASCRAVAPMEPAPPAPPIPTSGSTDQAVADVLVVYTPLAEELLGGPNAMQALIAASMVVTNQSLANSEVNLTVELAASVLVTYDETLHPFDFHLQALQGQTDGHMDSVHDLRAEVGADFVALLIAPVGNLCGQAFVMQTPSASFANSAFSVTRTDCAVGNLTFPHELGHNMGCAHDRDNAGVQGSFPFSFGFRDPVDATWRTVMALSPGTRIEHFSNPEVLYFGEPTGVPAGEPDSADNAMTINLNAPIIEAWVDPPCQADITGDQEVDGADIGVLLNAWGACPSGQQTCLGDVNEDGIVNGTDLGLLLSAWGLCK